MHWWAGFVKHLIDRCQVRNMSVVTYTQKTYIETFSTTHVRATDEVAKTYSSSPLPHQAHTRLLLVKYSPLHCKNFLCLSWSFVPMRTWSWSCRWSGGNTAEHVWNEKNIVTFENRKFCCCCRRRCRVTVQKKNVKALTNNESIKNRLMTFWFINEIRATQRAIDF